MTKAEKYNKKLDNIFNPEIERLEKTEKIAEEILDSLNKIVLIDSRGLEKCHLINNIQRVISKYR